MVKGADFAGFSHSAALHSRISIQLSCIFLLDYSSFRETTIDAPPLESKTTAKSPCLTKPLSDCTNKTAKSPYLTVRDLHAAEWEAREPDQAKERRQAIREHKDGRVPDNLKPQEPRSA